MGVLLTSLPIAGCATVVGTAASPVTGAVDLCGITIENGQWYLAPLAVAGGIVLRPFWGVGNGLRYDYNYHGRRWGEDFGRVFLPFSSEAAFVADEGWPPRRCWAVPSESSR